LAGIAPYVLGVMFFIYKSVFSPTIELVLAHGFVVHNFSFLEEKRWFTTIKKKMEQFNRF
jgi:hypothetical protein